MTTTTLNPNALFCIALFVFGAIVVGAALLMRERLRTSLGSSRIELKIGENHALSATPLPLVIILGFLSVLGAGYLWSKGYDKKLEDMKNQVEQINVALAKLQRYDVVYRLAFPTDNLPSDLTTLTYNVNITHERAAVPERYENARFGSGPGGAEGTVWDLSRGDSISITVVSNSDHKSWVSDPLKVTEIAAPLRLRRTN